MFWNTFARIILRQRLIILIVIGIITIMMGYFSQDIKLQYGLPKMLPDTDSTVIEYQEFRDRFGEESIVIVAGIEKDPYSNLTLFNAWYALNQNLKSINGVDTIVSATSI